MIHELFNFTNIQFRPVRDDDVNGGGAYNEYRLFYHGTISLYPLAHQWFHEISN